MNSSSIYYVSLSPSSCFPQVMGSFWVLGDGVSGVCGSRTWAELFFGVQINPETKYPSLGLNARVESQGEVKSRREFGWQKGRLNSD